MDGNARLIAVSDLSANSATGSWKNYRITVDAIETLTGYDLLNQLSVVPQGLLESSQHNL